MSKLMPVNGRVVVEPTDTDSITPGGIYLPERLKTIEKPEVGIVVDIDLTERHRLNDQLKPGTKILFNKFAATPIERKIAGKPNKKYLLMIKDSILAIYKNEEVPKTS